jgi:1,4-dihydroxy-2-naphthoate polyprenyltransferase
VSGWRSWVQASRPLAQANVALPLLIGQALAWRSTGAFDVALCGLLAVWGLLDQLFIVYANDYADRDADAANPTPTLFSGGSRVLVEGKLVPRSLARAAWLAFALLGALSTWLALGWGRPLTLVAWLAAGLLLWAYSFPPLRLSYRGGGEWLQALGTGGVLPLLGFATQAGGLTAFPWPALAATLTLGYAGNLLTALPDLDADAACGKRTFPVRHGATWARRTVVLGHSMAALFVVGIGPPLSGEAAGLVAAPCLLLCAVGSRGSEVRTVWACGAAGGWLLAAWGLALAQP